MLWVVPMYVVYVRKCGMLSVGRAITAFKGDNQTKIQFVTFTSKFFHQYVCEQKGFDETFTCFYCEVLLNMSLVSGLGLKRVFNIGKVPCVAR